MSDCCSSNASNCSGGSEETSTSSVAENADKIQEKQESSYCGSQAIPKKYTCPTDNNKYNEVDYKTVLHHIKQPWKYSITEQAYYFCNSAECDVVYFGLDNTEIRKEQLRTKVGVKTPDDDDALVCYCFDVLMAEAKKDKKIKAYVAGQTKNGTCSCAIFNPSGKCCLKDFPK